MTGDEKELLIYETRTGKVPFKEWIEALRDKKGCTVIEARLDRLERGNAGMCQSVGNGVYELKIHFGPGYRIYFGQDGKVLIILLCGGDKKSQEKDIQNAKEYWIDYKERQ